MITDLKWFRKHWETTSGSRPQKTRANKSLGKHGIMSNFKSVLFP